MSEDQRPGAIHWIDHFAVPTSDLDRWVDWAENVLGAKESWGATGESHGPRFAEFRNLGGSHIIGFVQSTPIPPNAGLGKAHPRYGFYVNAADIDEHRRRLDQLNVPHTDPVRVSDGGEPGTAIYFEDPDANQYELWAPNRLPDGAMDKMSALKVGRISHGVHESRDLARTAEFYTRYCGIDPMAGADIPDDTLVFPMVAGSRLIFKKVDSLDVRTGGSTKWRGVHNAYIVRADEFMSAYQRVWSELSEWDFDQRKDDPIADPAALPARTGMHGSEAGRKWKAMYGRGDQIYDPDTNSFHFVGGSSAGPNLATYEGHYMEDYVEAFMKAKQSGAGS
ncbi:MAG TPA: VOC family protein [Chloroflexota bacterium]|nr:VOC family protein [Chloroflexota bacterium]